MRRIPEDLNFDPTLSAWKRIVQKPQDPEITNANAQASSPTETYEARPGAPLVRVYKSDGLAYTPIHPSPVEAPEPKV